MNISVCRFVRRLRKTCYGGLLYLLSVGISYAEEKQSPPSTLPAVPVPVLSQSVQPPQVEGSAKSTPNPMPASAPPASGPDINLCESAPDKGSPKTFLGWENDSFLLRSADKDFILRFTGQIQSDYRSYLGTNDLTDIDTFLVRRARLGIEATVAKFYEFRLLPDFEQSGSGTTKIQDAYMNVHYWDAFQIEAGRFKQPVSYEQLIQDRYVPSMERSLLDQLVPARDPGIMIHGQKLLCGKLEYAVGVFNGTINGDLDTNDRKDVAARVAVAPFRTDANDFPLLQNVLIGVSGSVGLEQEPMSPVTLKTPAQVPWFTFNSTVRANGLRTRITPEISYFYGPFGMMAQYYIEHERLQPGGTGVAAANTLYNLPFEGFQALGSLLLTGETRTTYSEAITPLRPYDPTHPIACPGAWELVARGSRLQLGSEVFDPRFPLADRTQFSRGASEVTVGFNWYLNRWVRMQFNYEHSWFDQPVRLGPGPSGLLNSDDALLTRLQIIF